MMRSTLMFEAGNSPHSLLHLTARYWHRSSFHWWPHLEYRAIQLGWMITTAKDILLLLSAFSSSSAAVPKIFLHRNVAFHLEALRPSDNQDFHIPREVGFLDRVSAADKRYTTGQVWKRKLQVGEKILGVAREEVCSMFQQFQPQSYQWAFILQGIAIGDSFLKIVSHVTEVGFIVGDISIWILFCQETKTNFEVSRAGIRDSTISDTGLNHLLGPKVSLIILATCNDCHQLSNVSSL